MKEEKQLVITAQNTSLKEVDLASNRQFVQNLQAALLLTLLEKKKITPFQFDQCQKMLGIKT